MTDPTRPLRPTPKQLRFAYGKSIRDVITTGLDVLFCGINPSLYSAATGRHFARPGNRFWPALHAAGFTARRLQPWETGALLEAKCGVTNLVSRATATAAEIRPDELRAGAQRLEAKVRRFRPRAVAIVGIGAFRIAFGDPGAMPGPQPRQLADALLWVLPNTSGLNANHQAADFARAFGKLRAALATSSN
jgi:double-stranded uracil-DNA glycosylase